jgi:hypothetical protein
LSPPTALDRLRCGQAASHNTDVAQIPRREFGWQGVTHSLGLTIPPVVEYFLDNPSEILEPYRFSVFHHKYLLICPIKTNSPLQNWLVIRITLQVTDLTLSLATSAAKPKAVRQELHTGRNGALPLKPASSVA